jgi:hypothetical protein
MSGRESLQHGLTEDRLSVKLAWVTYAGTKGPPAT